MIGPNLDVDNIYTMFNISAYEKEQSALPIKNTYNLDKMAELAKSQADAKNEQALKEMLAKNMHSTPGLETEVKEELGDFLVKSNKFIGEVKKTMDIFFKLELKMQKHKLRIIKLIDQIIIENNIKAAPKWKYNTTLLWFADQSMFDHLSQVISKHASDLISSEQLETELANAAFKVMYAGIPSKFEVFTDYPFGILYKKAEIFMTEQDTLILAPLVEDHYIKHIMFFERFLENTLKMLGISEDQVEAAKQTFLKQLESGTLNINSMQQLQSALFPKKKKQLSKEKIEKLQEFVKKFRENMAKGRPD